MKYSILKKIAAFLALAALSAINLYSQDRDAIINTFNNGVKQIQTNIDSAIISFNNVIKMSDKVGTAADDMKQKAIQALPSLYLKSATDKLNAKKPATDVVKSAKQAIASAEKYNNAEVKESAKNILALAYNRMGTEFFSKKDYDKALASFDSVLTVNPENVSAIYNKALIYRTQNNSDALEQTVDMYISKLTPADSVKKKQASQMALDYFRASGSKANQAEKLDEALKLLDKAAKYGEDEDLNYFFADVYNKKKDFSKGAEYAQKGLEMEKGNAEAKAKFYFQLGLAHEGQGKTAEACASFKNALYGPFAAPSKAKMANLKCK